MLKPYSKLPVPFYVGRVGQSLDDVRKMQYHRRPFADFDMLNYSFVYPNTYVPDSQLWIPTFYDPTVFDNGSNDITLYSINDDIFTYVTSNPIEYKSAYGDKWLVFNGGLDYDDYPPAGLYYLVIENEQGRYSVSEVFKIACDGELDNKIKIRFWNSTDVANILYRDGYTNTIYVENGLRYMGATIDENGEEDEDGNINYTHQVYRETYELQLFVMPHQADALMMLKLHDNVYLTRPENGIEGKIEITSINYEPQNDKEWGVLNIQFREVDYTIKTGCGEFIPLVS